MAPIQLKAKLFVIITATYVERIHEMADIAFDSQYSAEYWVDEYAVMRIVRHYKQEHNVFGQMARLMRVSHTTIATR